MVPYKPILHKRPSIQSGHRLRRRLPSWPGGFQLKLSTDVPVHDVAFHVHPTRLQLTTCCDVLDCLRCIFGLLWWILSSVGLVLSSGSCAAIISVSVSVSVAHTKQWFDLPRCFLVLLLLLLTAAWVIHLAGHHLERSSWCTQPASFSLVCNCWTFLASWYQWPLSPLLASLLGCPTWTATSWPGFSDLLVTQHILI